MSQLSAHFELAEMVRPNPPPATVPEDVRANLAALCAEILEPVREHFGLPVRVTSGWRPFAYNAAIGGAKDSDHVYGRAADFHVADSDKAPWEVNTLLAFHWIRENLAGKFGQLIWEDHRVKLSAPSRLWIHVAIPSVRQPGYPQDVNRLLVSHAPKQYVVWEKGLA